MLDEKAAVFATEIAKRQLFYNAEYLRNFV